MDLGDGRYELSLGLNEVKMPKKHQRGNAHGSGVQEKRWSGNKNLEVTDKSALHIRRFHILEFNQPWILIS